MFSAFCRRLLPLALGACLTAPAFAAPLPTGAIANEQARHIATYFPGRMTGSPAEQLGADYVRQQFIDYGYPADLRPFVRRFLFSHKNHTQTWEKADGTMVIAAHPGSVKEQIIILAHLDTYAPHSDDDINNNLGGLTLQGIDDNAMGVGVMLELAERLKDVKTHYTVRFIASSGEEEGKLGAEMLLQRMSEKEKKETLLVINLDNLVVGDNLYFNSGVKTPDAIRKLTRDRALTIARREGISAQTNPGHNPDYPKGTGCCNDAEVFDKAGIPVLSVEATNWSLGHKDGYQQREKSAAFPDGTSWHDIRLDNQEYIDKHLPGRIEHRGRDVVKIMLPLVKELAKVPKATAPKKSPKHHVASLHR